MREVVKTETLVLLYPHEIVTTWDELRLKLCALASGDEHRLGGWFGALTRRVKHLRSRANRAYLIVHRDEDGEVSPLSPRFPCYPGDAVIDSKVVVDAKGAWLTRHPDPNAILDLITGSSLIMAGFHFVDCVPEFAGAAAQRGKTVMIAPLATDLHYLRCKLLTRKIPLPDDVPLLVDLQDFEGILNQYRRWSETEEEVAG